jgi:hypothetical protein
MVDHLSATLHGKVRCEYEKCYNALTSFIHKS